MKNDTKNFKLDLLLGDTDAIDEFNRLIDDQYMSDEPESDKAKKALLQLGFAQEDIDRITVSNVKMAFTTEQGRAMLKSWIDEQLKKNEPEKQKSVILKAIADSIDRLEKLAGQSAKETATLGRLKKFINTAFTGNPEKIDAEVQEITNRTNELKKDQEVLETKRKILNGEDFLTAEEDLSITNNKDFEQVLQKRGFTEAELTQLKTGGSSSKETKVGEKTVTIRVDTDINLQMALRNQSSLPGRDQLLKDTDDKLNKINQRLPKWEDLKNNFLKLKKVLTLLNSIGKKPTPSEAIKNLAEKKKEQEEEIKIDSTKVTVHEILSGKTLDQREEKKEERIVRPPRSSVNVQRISKKEVAPVKTPDKVIKVKDGEKMTNLEYSDMMKKKR